MSFANSNEYLDGRKPVPSGQGAEVLSARFSITLATGDLALNDIGAVGILPAGHVPVGLLVDSDDLDSNGAPAVVLSVGVLNAAGNDISVGAADGGAAWGTGLTVGQAGGQVSVESKALSRVQPSASDRKIAVKVTTAAATAQSGELGLTLLFRAA